MADEMRFVARTNDGIDHRVVPNTLEGYYTDTACGLHGAAYSVMFNEGNRDVPVAPTCSKCFTPAADRPSVRETLNDVHSSLSQAQIRSGAMLYRQRHHR